MNAKTQVAEAPADLTGTQLMTLDPDKYVAAVFAPFRERLDAAKAAAKDIKAEVGTKEGMLVAIKQRALFRSLRIEIEAARKTRKEPILDISRKLDGRAHELTDEITHDEERFDAAIKAEETRKEREQAEREAAEAARLLNIQNCIAEIVAKPGTMVGKPSSVIKVALDDMIAHDVTTWAQEHVKAAQEAQAHAVGTLQQLHAGALATERAAAEEKARIESERAELARLRAEQDERNRTEQARIAEETRQRAEAAAKARAEIEAAERASREKIEAEERAARRRQDEEAARQKAIRDEQEKAWAEKQAQEQAKRAQEEAEARRQAEAQAERERALRAEQERLDAEKREVARRQEEVLQTDRLIGVLRDRIKGEKRYAGIAKAIDAYIAASTSKSVAKRVEAQSGEAA